LACVCSTWVLCIWALWSTSAACTSLICLRANVARGLAYVEVGVGRVGLCECGVVCGVRVYVCDVVDKECRKRGALRDDMCVSDGVEKRKFTLEMERDMSGERVSVKALIVQGDNRR